MVKFNNGVVTSVCRSCQKVSETSVKELSVYSGVGSMTLLLPRCSCRSQSHCQVLMSDNRDTPELQVRKDIICAVLGEGTFLEGASPATTAEQVTPTQFLGWASKGGK